MYKDTLLELLEPHQTRQEGAAAFSFWDGARPLGLRKNLTYRGLRKKALAFSYALHNYLKIVPGERVAFFLGNTLQFPIAYFGTLYAGAIPVPVNPLLKSEEISKILKNAGVSAAVMMDLLYPRIGEAVFGAGARSVMVTNVDDTLPLFKVGGRFLKEIFGKKTANKSPEIMYDNERIFNWSEILAASSGQRFSAHSKPKDIALFLYTSGTTGEPKAVVFTHEALLENARACQKLLLFDLNIGKGATFLAAAPYFHIMGLAALLHTSLLMDAKTILIADKDFFSLNRKILEAANYLKADAFVGAPRNYEFMIRALQHKTIKYDLSSLKLCISGSARLGEETRRKFENLCGVKIIEGYGMSEGGIFACQKPWKAKNGSVGRALDGVSLKLLNQDENGVGELLTKNRGIMLGYWKEKGGIDLEKTSSVFDKDGWFHTGDTARVDEDGDVFLMDRVDDVIKLSGGEKISALEIEECIARHPHVSESAVVRMANAKGRDIMKAFVVLRDPKMSCGDFVKTEILKYCRESLPPYKVPDAVECVPELPKNAFGKVLKKQLRQMVNGS